MEKKTETTRGKVKDSKELIKQKLIMLTDQKAKMMAQANELQQTIKNDEKNLRRVVDDHNKMQAQIEVLQEILDAEQKNSVGVK